MPLSLPILDASDEVHTSELTAQCKRAVALKKQGLFRPEVPTAMFRGSLFGKCIELYYMDGLPLETVTDTACKITIASCEAEGRKLTEACARKLPEITDEVHKCVVEWPRVEKYLNGGNDRAIFVGAEIPIRGSIVVGDSVQKLASHVDLLWRMERSGTYILADCKFHDDPPTNAYLHRNLQLAVYRILFQHGAMQFPDGGWYRPNASVRVAWIHAPYLKPCGRAQKFTDPDTGVEMDLVKGDHRPTSAVVRWVDFSEERIATIADELRLHIQAMRAGLWLTNPEKTRCHICECADWCDRFDMAPLYGAQR